ncbi:DUF58 domain-containing protein [Isoptericola variabilis]|uniref:DUF58 domain-containing protein n=1 Tax=Isoptericola variabilis (strain 225) TaxID=743718 RepID=F6FVB4_ISOV2|nr:DUF58 domain-containing protein [Isoptericola variabilis]AEG43387.1 protein of unknown function DUF58 [Isoptericola variabilis 225]TWH34558.1 uncharacterized protein (DUF58 family) [Isoptericola variabilis J7]
MTSTFERVTARVDAAPVDAAAAAPVPAPDAAPDAPAPTPGSPSLRGRLGAATAAVTVALARARGRVAPVVGVVSAFGWGVLVLVAAAWWAGLALRWQEAAVVAVVGTVALLAAVAFVLGRLRYTVTLDLAARRVVVGDRAVGRLLVRNDSPRPMLPAVMELQVGKGMASFPVPRLRPGGEHEELFAVPTQRRAVIPLGPVRSVRSDPLGLLRRELVWTEPEELFVHPRTLPLSGSSTGYLHDLEGRVTPDISDSDVSFHALRDYVPGDDRRHIHWKSTARTGQLMVRQFEETRRSRLAVILSTRVEDYAHPDEFELAVSVCGSLGLQAIREDGGLTVLVQQGRVRGDHRTRMLDDLTRLELAPARTTLADVARVAAATVTDASVVAVVVGSTVTPTDLRAAAVRLPVDARLVALRCSAGSGVSRGRVADMQVLTLGELGDLPNALRRMHD